MSTKPTPVTDYWTVADKPSPEVFHSRFECDLCGREDHCVRVYGGERAKRVDICSACIAHMHGLYDELERDFPSCELRRNFHYFTCANCRKGMNRPYKSYAYGHGKGTVELCGKECDDVWLNYLELPTMFGLEPDEHGGP